MLAGVNSNYEVGCMMMHGHAVRVDVTEYHLIITIAAS